MGRFLLTSAVARMLGVCERTVLNWANQGRLRVTRAGRVRLFDARQVEELASQRTSNAQLQPQAGTKTGTERA